MLYQSPIATRRLLGLTGVNSTLIGYEMKTVFACGVATCMFATASWADMPTYAYGPAEINGDYRTNATEADQKYNKWFLLSGVVQAIRIDARKKTWVEIRDPDDKVTMDYVAAEVRSVQVAKYRPFDEILLVCHGTHGSQSAGDSTFALVFNCSLATPPADMPTYGPGEINMDYRENWTAANQKYNKWFLLSGVVQAIRIYDAWSTWVEIRDPDDKVATDYVVADVRPDQRETVAKYRRWDEILLVCHGTYGLAGGATVAVVDNCSLVTPW